MSTRGKPAFYLTTAGEYKLLSKPRACWPVGRLKDVNRDDYMLVEIGPPLIGQSFGLGGTDVCELLLSTRHKGFTLFPVKEWPTHVYVARVVDDKVLTAKSFARDQVQLIAWGMIFANLEDAIRCASELESELI